MFWLFGCNACGILAPDQGLNPHPPSLEGKVLTTGLPGKPEGERGLSEKAGLTWQNSTFKKLRSWHPVPSLHEK